MNKVIKTIALQCRFFLMEWINLTYVLAPYPLRNLYLRFFGIKMGITSIVHRKCKFFSVGKFKAGQHVIINFGCYLDNRRGLYIGNNVCIGHNVKIYTLGHNIDSPFFKTMGKPVKIEDNVFFFANVLVMPGVTIHEGAVILPGAVVTKDVPEYSVVGGNPAKFIRERPRNIRYSAKFHYLFAL